MSNPLTLAIILSLLGASLAAICPPAADLTPCTCTEATAKISCVNIPGRFDIKAVFDKVTPLIDQSTIFTELEIRETSLFEIPDDAIPGLQFRTITVDFNRGLDYISPYAFNRTFAITEDLSLWNNALTNHAPNNPNGQEIFELFNKFTNVSKIWLPSNAITSIPPNAFTENPNLRQLYFGSNQISSIGAYAFAALPNLENVWLSFNNIEYEGLSPDTFQSIGNKTDIDLTYNSGISYLNEGIFKPLLDGALHVGVGGRSCNSHGCTYRYLNCDNRADWMCPHEMEYQPKLAGFLCVGGNPANVWEYCQGLGRMH